MAAWLSASGLGEYAAPFEANHVDGAALRLLSRDDLSALGVQSVGHRLQILRAVGELCAPERDEAAGAARSLRFGGAPAGRPADAPEAEGDAADAPWDVNMC